VPEFFVIGAVIGLAALVFGLVLGYLTFLRKAGPNEVIVVSGRGPVRFITGGAGVVVPLFSTWNRLSLEIMTLDVTTPEVYTSQGVPVIVDGVAQIKIKKDQASLHAASERFLGKRTEEISRIALETVQGHLRAILGTMSVEDIYKNRDQFAQKVQEVSAGDLANMGLGIDSFTIRDIRDKHGYLEALGKPRIAEVKRTAAIAEAIALKEASIAQADAQRETRERQAEALQLAQEAEAKRDAAVAEANADKQRRQREADATSNRASEIANFQAQQAIAEQQGVANRKRAEAEMAYDLQKKTMEIQVQ
jgi:flotillin